MASDAKSASKHLHPIAELIFWFGLLSISTNTLDFVSVLKEISELNEAENTTSLMENYGRWSAFYQPRKSYGTRLEYESMCASIEAFNYVIQQFYWIGLAVTIDLYIRISKLLPKHFLKLP